MNKSINQPIPSGITFPYADDSTQKQKQLWKNLQRGLLFEDQGIFVPWNTACQSLASFGAEQIEQNDRIIWHFGKRTILDSFESRLHILQWRATGKVKIDTFIEEFGQNYKGYNRFQKVQEHLTTLLGAPDDHDMEPAGPMNLGLIEWKQGDVEITLIGIEHFSYRYSMRIEYTT